MIIELDGADAELATLNNQVSELLRSHGTYQIDEAHDASEARLWKGRKSAFPAVGRLSPDYLCMDGTIRARRYQRCCLRLTLFPKPGLAVANVFHAADGRTR